MVYYINLYFNLSGLQEDEFNLNKQEYLLEINECLKKEELILAFFKIDIY